MESESREEANLEDHLKQTAELLAQVENSNEEIYRKNGTERKIGCNPGYMAENQMTSHKRTEQKYPSKNAGKLLDVAFKTSRMK